MEAAFPDPASSGSVQVQNGHDLNHPHQYISQRRESAPMSAANGITPTEQVSIVVDQSPSVLHEHPSAASFYSPTDRHSSALSAAPPSGQYSSVESHYYVASAPPGSEPIVIGHSPAHIAAPLHYSHSSAHHPPGYSTGEPGPRPDLHSPYVSVPGSYPPSTNPPSSYQPFARSSSIHHPVPYTDLTHSYNRLYKKFKLLSKKFKKSQKTVTRLRNERKVLNELLQNTKAIRQLAMASDDEDDASGSDNSQSGEDDDHDMDTAEDEDEDTMDPEIDEDEDLMNDIEEEEDPAIILKLPRTIHDPRAPKRPQNPYMLFAEEQRETVKAEREQRSRAGTNEAEDELYSLPKALGAKWKALPAEEKEHYQKLFKENMEEYDKQMTRFLQDNPDVLKQVKQVKAAKRKQWKNPSPSQGEDNNVDRPPRRPTNPYFVFCQTEKARLKVYRDNLLKENPNSEEAISLGNLTKAMGANWRKLTDEERKVYQDEYRRQVEVFMEWHRQRGLEPPPYRETPNAKSSKSKKSTSLNLPTTLLADPSSQTSSVADLNPDGDDEELDEEVDELDDVAINQDLGDLGTEATDDQ